MIIICVLNQINFHYLFKNTYLNYQSRYCLSV